MKLYTTNHVPVIDVCNRERQREEERHQLQAANQIGCFQTGTVPAH